MRWRCPFLLITVGAATLSLTAAEPPPASAPSAPENPNIIFILADDLRFDMLGIAGNDDPRPRGGAPIHLSGLMNSPREHRAACRGNASDEINAHPDPRGGASA